MMLLLVGCTGSEPADTAASVCDGAPFASWDSFGHGFLVEQCQPCHATTAPERYGAPVEVTFDDEAIALAQKSSILRVATGDAPTMPPAISVEERDRYLLEVWLTCWVD